MITIYTDGSSKGNPGPGGWGAVIISPQKVVELGGREDHTTNNRMELTAAIKALEFVSEPEVTIHTDSEYVMKGITLWIEGWQKRGWKTAAKKPVLNQDLWQELLHVSADKKVEWKYVAGHSGHDLNERCDEIATSFADLPALPTGQAGGRQVISPELYDGAKDRYKIVF